MFDCSAQSIDDDGYDDEFNPKDKEEHEEIINDSINGHLIDNE